MGCCRLWQPAARVIQGDFHSVIGLGIVRAPGRHVHLVVPALGGCGGGPAPARNRSIGKPPPSREKENPNRRRGTADEFQVRSWPPGASVLLQTSIHSQVIREPGETGEIHSRGRSQWPGLDDRLHGCEPRDLSTRPVRNVGLWLMLAGGFTSISLSTRMV